MLGSIRNLLSFIPADFQTLFLVIGFAWFAVLLFKIAKFVSMYFMRAPVDPKKYGEWAIVTGCTDGIGKAMAEELAKKGMKLVLVSRNPQTLKAQAEEFGKLFFFLGLFLWDFLSHLDLFIVYVE